MVQRRTRSAGLFLLAQLIIIAVVWIGLLAVYVLDNAVNRVVDLLDTISKQLTMTPQEKEKEG
jgi:hypothetical protein